MDLRIFVEPQQGTSYGRLLTLATRTEQLGFDGFFSSDHYLAMGASDGLPGPTDALTTMAGLARDTTRIRLGTLVSPITFRHPGNFAIAAAQIDDMSGGRFELGVGAGWFEAEHQTNAIPFPATRERFDRMAEQLAIITGMWATPIGQTFSFAGDHYSLAGSPGLPKPAQTPRLPIIIGGTGPRRTPRLAATYADEFNALFEAPDSFAEIRARVRKACEAQDRDPDSMVFSIAQTLCCGADEDEVERRAARLGRDAATLRDSGVAGTPEECVARIRAYADRGCSRVYLQVLDDTDLDHLDLVASEVAPAI